MDSLHSRWASIGGAGSHIPVELSIIPGRSQNVKTSKRQNKENLKKSKQRKRHKGLTVRRFDVSTFQRGWGAITPIGGVAFLVGRLCLVVGVWRGAGGR